MNPVLQWFQSHAAFCNTYDVVMFGLTIGTPIAAVVLLELALERLFRRRR